MMRAADRDRMNHKGTNAVRGSEMIDCQVCVCVCVHRDKKKDWYLFHSPSLTRVFTEWRCVSIDQVLLPCEHFYSPKEQ